MIYLILSGRIGNQLFMYAAAESIRKQLGDEDEIIINEKDVIDSDWINSLREYNLENVRFVNEDYLQYTHGFKLQHIIFRYYMDFVVSKNYRKKFIKEVQLQRLFNANGLILCQNGYTPLKNIKKRDGIVLMMGYFQSEMYFSAFSDVIKKEFDVTSRIEEYDPIICNEFRKRNVICISAKVQHNVGNPMFDICTQEYWKKAIAYIIDKVDKPLFFICSDNVEYVTNNLIDTSKYDVIKQPKDMPVHITLALMSLSKHFIIGNTTFAWWAQFLCKNPTKIVVAPSRWMNSDMPIDIYQDGWKIIGV